MSRLEGMLRYIGALMNQEPRDLTIEDVARVESILIRRQDYQLHPDARRNLELFLKHDYAWDITEDGVASMKPETRAAIKEYLGEGL